MEKTLTIPIPNELWVNDFSENKTAQFNYSGPNKVWFVIQQADTKIIVSRVSTTEPVLQANEFVVPVEIATATDAELAAAIILQPDSTPYQYVKQTNYDNSVYYKISNPKLSDYYSVASGPTGVLSLTFIEKHMPNPNLLPALQKKQLVENYLSNHTLDADDQAKAQAYLTLISNYIDKIKTAYTWKFISIPQDIPEIPDELMMLFNTLPPVVSETTIPA